MGNFPFRLLAIGYGAAACAATGLWLAGIGGLAALLTFWFGGAITTLAVAFARYEPEGRASGVVDAAVARDAAGWEKDGIDDRAPGASDRGARSA